VSGPLVDLAPFLSTDRVVFIDDAPSKRDALLYIAEVTAARFPPKDRAAFVKAIYEREDVTSTGMGCGVAIPHARLPSLPGCVISIAICAQGIDFSARDSRPVHIIAMIAARDRDRAEHLRVLASVAALLQDPALRERLLSAHDADSVIAALSHHAAE
jgi:mannitol/fructose-specific phosphotransferase system IIA component (Ntr-type)